MKRIRLCVLTILIGVVTGLCGSTLAGTEHPEERAKTLQLLMRKVTIEVNETRVEEIVEFVRTLSGADIDVMWLDDDHSEGIDKDATVSFNVTDVTALDLLERVLAKTGTDFEENDWQLTPSGGFVMGPESRLNRRRTLKLYDVQDMLYEVPNFGNVPALDLDQILQQSSGQGGGGGGNIVSDDEAGDGEGKSREELVSELIDLVITNIEPEQWEDNGGEGASIRFYRGSLIISAPDYIHRQLGAYSVPSGK